MPVPQDRIDFERQLAEHLLDVRLELVPLK